MNSRPEHRVSYNVRAPSTLRLPCLVFVLRLLLCIYCFFPPLFSGRPSILPSLTLLCPTTSPTIVPLLSSYQASRAIPLSHISPTFLYLSVALGICCCYVTFLFKCIACLCCPLMYLSFILLQRI